MKILVKKSELIGIVVLTSVSAFLMFGCGGGGSKKVFFGNLQDGASIESPFKVQMKAENLIVEPATLGVNEGHGHFHIIVDASLASPSEPMNKDEKHIHYGAGQSESLLDLSVGKHTLILQFAKGNHVPYDPPIYQQVEITVTKENKVDTTATKTPDSTSAARTTHDSTKAVTTDTSKAAKKK